MTCDHSAANQRARLKHHLQLYERITTTDARKALDILAPATRIWELRHQEGINIVTYRKTITTDAGSERRVAEYVLLPGKYQGGAHANN